MKSLLSSAVAGLAIVLGSLAAAPAMAQSDEDVVGEAPVTETFDNWEKRCGDDGRCYIFQQALNEEAKPLLRVRIVKLESPIPDGEGGQVLARADIITPLDVFLPQGVGLKIDDGPIQTALYVRCRPVGCVACPPLTSALIDNMKSGGTATFILSRDAQADPILAPLSLSGFTAAFDSL